MVGLRSSRGEKQVDAFRRFGRFVLVALAACGCRTTTQESPAGVRDVAARQATLQATWEVRSGLELHGFVARYASNDEPPRTYFLVQNRDRQDLGLIDSYGRAWRYQAHERESEWVTTGTVLQGARAILEAGPDAELVEVRSEPTPAPGS